MFKQLFWPPGVAHAARDEHGELEAVVLESHKKDDGSTERHQSVSSKACAVLHTTFP